MCETQGEPLLLFDAHTLAAVVDAKKRILPTIILHLVIVHEILPFNGLSRLLKLYLGSTASSKPTQGDQLSHECRISSSICQFMSTYVSIKALAARQSLRKSNTEVVCV
jgi:hypothetical protein